MDNFGVEGEGLTALNMALDQATAALVADAAGAMQRVAEITRDYMKVRT